MNEELQGSDPERVGPEKDKKNYLLPVSILVSVVIIAGTWIYTSGLNRQKESEQIQSQSRESAVNTLEDKVAPPEGMVLPVRWGDLGKKLVDAGVIDPEKFGALYEKSGEVSRDIKQLLYGENNDNLRITSENSGMVLNLLWALGLGVKNDILETGPMSDPRYGGAGNFASTGGWTLARGNAMNHYSRHPFIILNEEQQTLVEDVSKNIYRPCCNNSTHFPDCNHGIAMLGLLELMASQGVSEEEMYRVALQVNAYWFPDTYLTIAKYLESRGVAWDKSNPKELLGYNFSSGSGYRQILSQVTAPVEKSSGSCGV